MIHYDLKRNNGYSETKKRRYFVYVCVCVFSYQLKKTFHIVKWSFIYLSS